MESTAIGVYIRNELPFDKINFPIIQLHAGIQVISETDWVEFVDKTMDAITDCHMLAIWDGECYLQCKELYAYMQRHYPYIHTVPAHILEPYLYMYQDDDGKTVDPLYRFPEIFQGKRVLIVTSHGDSVRYQIEHHLHKIFEPYRIFSDPELIQVYKCPQQNGTNGDGYGWKGHFLKMCYDISQFEFDVAFIGCGGFSNLLGHYIYRELGRSAIYVGGPIQLYFGVMGQRWARHPTILSFLGRNGDHWIEPMASDTPSKKESVEGGCYWL